ncbi:c-type cytochrome [Donghicola mangrovi]|uniref:C-type cytochrome n=1 Tax=Donghicola mangrovi TaxID=2729614 RepID=A0A850Q1D1_9RHOB|nr:c-type cytochrome [Donghicola mangrovi]
MREVLKFLIIFGMIGGAAAWWLSRPTHWEFNEDVALVGDPEHGREVFLAGGCASCHASGDSDDKLTLSGGMKIPSPFGMFVVPNISTDPEHGIGGWTPDQFADAVLRGVSPEGTHYFPAFPYTSYIHMDPQDVIDLFAYMQTLPPSAQDNPPHDIRFPYNIRRAVGLWKQLYLKEGYTVTAAPGAQIQRGRYLVEALGHCGECHTPRDEFGGLIRSEWLHGAPNPAGKGEIPGITRTLLGWKKADIAYYLATGFTPDYDSAGGHMALVIENTAQLPPEDREAIAAYLMALP